MCRNSYNTDKRQSNSVRIETVNAWHSRWDDVREAIDVQLEPDGWLSARRVLLVAFVEDRVAGHVSFRVEPQANLDGRRQVDAVVETVGVQWGFDETQLRRLLLVAARRRAVLLGCATLAGFESAACEERACCGIV